MAKGDKKKPPKADKNWMDRLATPSRQAFMQYLKGQSGQFDPLINRLQMQIAGSAPEKDPVALAYERLSAGLPTGEAISQAYGGGLQNLTNFMKDVNVARGGQAVSEAVKGIAGAVGADTGTAADVATAAGAVSGVGGGQDILSQALLESAGARFKGLEAQSLSDIAGQRQQFAMGAGEARLAAKERQRELARTMAELKGKKIASRQNPFEIAGMIMNFQAAKKAASGGYGGGGGGSAATPTPQQGGADPGEVAYRREAIASGLQGLITPQSMRPSGFGSTTNGVVSTPGGSMIVQGPMAGTGYRAPVGPDRSVVPAKPPTKSKGRGSSGGNASILPGLWDYIKGGSKSSSL